jgi:RNA polymerase sigma-70 factor (ECF subfamily)
MVARYVRLKDMTHSEQPDLPPFWALVEEHGGELLRHARRLTGDSAEDVLHDALLKALRSYPRLTDGRHLRAWLYRVTTTTAFDHNGRRSAKAEVLMGELPETFAYDGEIDGFEELIRDLPASSQTVLRMRFVQDRPYTEMAKKLDCSEVAARQRVSSAVRAMRRRMT